MTWLIMAHTRRSTVACEFGCIGSHASSFYRDENNRTTVTSKPSIRKGMARGMWDQKKRKA